MSISNVLVQRYSEYKWSIIGKNQNLYTNLVWADSNSIPKPTEQELIDLEVEAQAEFDNKKNRKKNLASTEEQLDMQYEDVVNSTTKWKDHRDSIESQYPKS